MLLPRNDEIFDHLSSVTHDGKVVLFAISTRKSESFGRIWYAVRQDGFESGALDKKVGPRSVWTDWRELPLPGYAVTAAGDHSTDPDASVQELEAKTLTFNTGARYIHRSLYDTFKLTADAPVQLISGMGHLYVFRQSIEGQILMDRFVLDGEKNLLVRKLEVRFRRSRQKFKPSGKMKRGKHGLSNIDSLDFRDIDNMPFYEPTTEISILGKVSNGWFSVVLAPTLKEDQFRWHFFFYSTDHDNLMLTSIRASDQGLLDVQDVIGLSEDDIKTGARPWGIVTREFTLRTARQADLTATAGPTATKYDLQKLKKTENGNQWLRDKTRVMLAVPASYQTQFTTEHCIATLSFAILGDGSLSPISTDVVGTDHPLRADEHDVALPLDNLDRLRTLAKARPTPTGEIERLGRDGNDQVVITSDADIRDVEIGDRVTLEGDANNGMFDHIDLVKIGELAAPISGQTDIVTLKAPLAQALTPGTKVRISGGGQCHVVEVAYGGDLGAYDFYIAVQGLEIPAGAMLHLADSFLVTPAAGDPVSIGAWTKVEDKDTGLVFDGIVVGFEKDAGGKLRVEAPGHGLNAGDKVQITETEALHGAYPITHKDANSLTLLKPFRTGQAINIKRQSDNRRALRLSPGSVINIPDNEIGQPFASRDFAMTISAWVKCPNYQKVAEGRSPDIIVVGLEGTADFRAFLRILDGGMANFWCSVPGHNISLDAPNPMPTDEWVHLASTLKWAPKGDSGVEITAELWQNGKCLTHQSFDNPHEQQTIDKRELSIGSYSGLELDISDVRLWSIAQSEKQLKTTMYLPLTGSEQGLIGYWRLGGIIEGAPQKVMDFSSFANDGLIEGMAVVSAKLLSRHLEDDITKAFMYQNADLIAVVQQGSYVESFEFQLESAVLHQNEHGNFCLPDGKLPFVLSYWGQSSRTSDDRLRFAEDQAIAPTHIEEVSFHPGWYRASCRVEIPDGISLIRTLELSDLHGDWSGLKIRRHRLKLVENTVTQGNFYDYPSLDALEVTTPPQDAVDLVRKHEDQDVALTIEETYLTGRINELTTIRDTTEQQRRERISQFNSDINDLRGKLTVAKSARTKAYTAFANQQNDVFNYWFSLKCREDMSLFTRIYTKGYALLYGGVGGPPKGLYSNNLFKFVDMPDGNKRIDCAWHSLTLQRFSFQDLMFGMVSGMPANMLRGSADLNDGAHWALTNNGDGSYGIQAIGENLYFTRHGNNIYLAAANNANSQKFVFTKAESTPVNDKIDQARMAYNAAAGAVVRAQNALDEMIRRRDAYQAQKVSQGELDYMIARLAQVKALHETTRTDLRNANIAYINAAHAPAAALVMSPVGDDVPLTSGACLDFAKPVGRISALESMAGMVQLSYFDRDGQFATTCYDTCADAKNSKFDEWLPPVVPKLELPPADTCKPLKTPIPLGTNWTFEFWVKGPLPIAEQADSLATWGPFLGSDGTMPAFVVLGEFHSVGPDQKMHGSGFRAEDVGPGWHHLAFAVEQVRGATMLSYYLDGVEVGKPTPVLDHYDIAFVGQGDDGLFGQPVEARVWNTRLKPSEIAIYRDLAVTGDEPGLIGWFPAERGGLEMLNPQEEDENSQPSVAFTAPRGRPMETTLLLDGVSEQIAIPGFTNYNMYTSEWTLEFWLYPEEQRADQQMFDNFGPLRGLMVQYAGFARFFMTNDASFKELARHTWHRISITCQDGWLRLYVNGVMVNGLRAEAIPANDDPVIIGAGGGRHFKGRITELRLWDRPFNEKELQRTAHLRLKGNEAGLAGYWPLKAEMNSDPRKAVDLVAGNHATLINGHYASDARLKFGAESAVSCEYSTFEKPVDGPSVPLLRRMFAHPLDGAIALQADQRIDTLTLQWVGNAQYDPTLLGYIEGPPPVPSENLTVQESYDGAVAVELKTSESLEYSWNRSKESAWGSNGELFLGMEQEFDEGITIPLVGQVASLKGLKAKIGFAGSVSSSHGDSAESTVSTGSGTAATDRLELRGHREAQAKFPVLGRRFVPKNIGYALVVSGLADVFITRLHKTGRMVSYDIRPNEDVPLDVNTITFLINPAYTMNGSLDGQTGTAATSERFFRHVPAMRAQFGSSYPASYMRLIEAYDLKKQIELQDKSREAYFQNFDAAVSKLLSDDGFEDEINKGAPPKTVGLTRPEDAPDDPDDKRSEKEKNAAKQAAIDKQMKDLQSSGKDQMADNKKKVDAKIAEIHNIQDASQRRNASGKFKQWQTRMEALRIRAGKRNIVNTYVWDGDGGLRTEEQQYSSTIEHSLGSAVTLDAALGGTFNINVMGPANELTAQATLNLTQTLHKTHNQTTALELSVDLGGMESTGITDFKDRPLIPGEKVDRYRFMSFYLEGSKKNFDDFFTFVVDPEWLISNDEEARALRAAKGKSNKAWRVLHRVTYVERPALMGFGADRRALEPSPAAKDSSLSRLELMELQIKELLSLMRGDQGC